MSEPFAPEIEECVQRLNDAEDVLIASMVSGREPKIPSAAVKPLADWLCATANSIAFHPELGINVEAEKFARAFVTGQPR